VISLSCECSGRLSPFSRLILDRGLILSVRNLFSSFGKLVPCPSWFSIPGLTHQTRFSNSGPLLIGFFFPRHLQGQLCPPLSSPSKEIFLPFPLAFRPAAFGRNYYPSFHSPPPFLNHEAPPWVNGRQLATRLMWRRFHNISVRLAIRRFFPPAQCPSYRTGLAPYCVVLGNLVTVPVADCDRLSSPTSFAFLIFRLRSFPFRDWCG